MGVDKKLGCCTICDTLIAPVIVTFPSDHPYAGEPRKIGRPFDDSIRLVIILTDGSTIDVTVCKECAVTAEDNLCLIWRKIVAGWARETSDEHRMLIGAKAYTKKERSDVNKWKAKILKHIPIGILCKTNWKDVK